MIVCPLHNFDIYQKMLSKSIFVLNHSNKNFAKCGNFTGFLPCTSRCCHLECQNTTDDDVPGGVKLPSGRTGCRARLPGSRTSFCALTWHRPGGVQITGTPVTGSRTGIICTIKTPGRCRGTQVTLCKWNMTSDTNSHCCCHYRLQTQDPAKMLLQSVARWDTLYQGVRVWSQLLLDHMECHKIIGREKYYERLSFIDAIWKVGHVIIYFPKLKGGHKTKINLPFKYDWT